jgi:hypothetical protein
METFTTRLAWYAPLTVTPPVRTLAAPPARPVRATPPVYRRPGGVRAALARPAR